MTRPWTVSVCVATLGLAYPALGQATFQGIGLFPSEGVSFTSPNGVSTDGLVVVGQALADPINSGGFRWSAETGLECLGPLLPDGTGGEGLAVNADGSVIVGKGWSVESGSNGEAYRWTAEGGMIGLGDLPGGIFRSTAFGVSGDGTIVVGGSITELGGEAFRWTEETGMVGLGGLDGPNLQGTASAITTDGTVIVGTSDGEFFRWTEQEGMVGLGASGGFIEAISADASVIVGELNHGQFGRQAFRWSEETGMVGLGGFPGGPSNNSLAFGVSGDGSIVVGFACTAMDFIFCEDLEPFIWDAQHGLRNFTVVLTEGYGLDLGGWELTAAKGISADGLTIVGVGGDPQGHKEGWIVQLPDCNGNGIADELDILDGISVDDNGNLIPDECDRDCNGNGQDDLEDIADGTSDDCDENGLPDECEADCNNNGQQDRCDIADGLSADCNGNTIPDECDEGTDCNGNDQLDSCDLAEGVSEDCNDNDIPDECEETVPIVEQPQDQQVEVGQFAFFSIVVDDLLPEYQWRKDGVELVDSERIFGSTQSQLLIFDIITEDAGEYDCLVSNIFGCSNTSDVATLTVLSTCLADFNGDGVVDPSDLTTILRDWGPCPGCPQDFNADGLVGPFDLAQLLGAWGPCP